ncbi:arginine deiminase type-3 [Cordyceps javanica]|uniref:Arginine deiminase type-3 n=1 Tax=Cordyceps javanica TaxID=43265 RepID=A0A545UW64_9HYPO|nr:arginine deiminase type-3 [Cordyceps javanica]TQW04496.1 arginine deiminase type-3 [Cordyceps javanica]
MRLAILTAVLPLATAVPASLTYKRAPTINDSLQVVILADTNRDGKVDIEGASDLGEGKKTWTETSGALFLPNIGDTSDRCRKQHQDSLSLVDCNDASGDMQWAPQYLAPLRTIPIDGLGMSAVGRISVSDPVARKSVRIFRPVYYWGEDGHGQPDWWVIVDNDMTFSAAELAKGLQLGIDARGPRGHLVTGLDTKSSKTDTPQTWDGRVTVTFSVTDRERSYTDSVMLRVAPVVTQNHLQPVAKVFTFLRGQNEEIFDGIAAAVKKAGIDEPVQETEGVGDFIQDLFETMYASMPGPDGSTISLPIILPAPLSTVFGKGSMKVASQIRSTGVGMITDVPPGTDTDTLDSMGNLETIPPYEHNGRSFPAGRIVMGANETAGRVPRAMSFVQAQEMQDPILVDSTWLEVQHVDEFLQFLPAKTPRKWSVMVSDPLAAVEILEAAKAEGHGDEPYTSHPPTGWRGASGTVNSNLDSGIREMNEECARRIQGTIDMLKRETGITDDEIFRVPVLYTKAYNPAIPSNGDFQARALLPSAVNGIVMNDSLYLAPKQWGLPNAAGTDTMEQAVRDAYAKAGFSVEFVDDWPFHLRKGDLHCITNVLREIPGSRAADALGSSLA